METRFEISVSSIIAPRRRRRQGGILAEFRAALLCNLPLPESSSTFCTPSVRSCYWIKEDAPCSIKRFYSPLLEERPVIKNKRIPLLLRGLIGIMKREYTVRG
jgi:hypothetical protein